VFTATNDKAFLTTTAGALPRPMRRNDAYYNIVALAAA